MKEKEEGLSLSVYWRFGRWEKQAEERRSCRYLTSRTPVGAKRQMMWHAPGRATLDLGGLEALPWQAIRQSPGVGCWGVSWSIVYTKLLTRYVGRCFVEQSHESFPAGEGSQRGCGWQTEQDKM